MDDQEDHIIQQVNDTLWDMTGYSARELTGRSSRMLYPTDADFNYVGEENPGGGTVVKVLLPALEETATETPW